MIADRLDRQPPFHPSHPATPIGAQVAMHSKFHPENLLHYCTTCVYVNMLFMNCFDVLPLFWWSKAGTGVPHRPVSRWLRAGVGTSTSQGHAAYLTGRAHCLQNKHKKKSSNNTDVAVSSLSRTKDRVNKPTPRLWPRSTVLMPGEEVHGNICTLT